MARHAINALAILAKRKRVAEDPSPSSVSISDEEAKKQADEEEAALTVGGVKIEEGGHVVILTKAYRKAAQDWGLYHHPMQTPPDTYQILYKSANAVVKELWARLAKYGPGCLVLHSKPNAVKVGILDAVRPHGMSKEQAAATDREEDTCSRSSAKPLAKPLLPIHPPLDPSASVGSPDISLRPENWARMTHAGNVPESVPWPAVTGWYYRYRLHPLPEARNGASITRKKRQAESKPKPSSSKKDAMQVLHAGAKRPADLVGKTGDLSSIPSSAPSIVGASSSSASSCGQESESDKASNAPAEKKPRT